MKKGTLMHPKTKDLARALRINRAWAAGILEAMWHFTLEYCPQGDIGRFTDAQIADACFWPEERSASELIDALVDSKWLDRNEQYRILVHDWVEHCDEYTHTKLARARQFFANGEPPKLCRLNREERHLAQDFYSSCAHKGDVCAHKSGNSAHIFTVPLPLPLPLPVNNSCTEPQKAAVAVPEEKVVLEIPTKGKEKGPFKVTVRMVEEFQKDFPAVDVLQEIRSARAWSVSNPDRQKTMRGVMRFLCTWISKAQNRPLFANGTQKQIQTPYKSKASSLPTAEELGLPPLPREKELIRRPIDLSGIGNMGKLLPGQEPPI